MFTKLGTARQSLIGSIPYSQQLEHRGFHARSVDRSLSWDYCFGNVFQKIYWIDYLLIILGVYIKCFSFQKNCRAEYHDFLVNIKNANLDHPRRR